MAVESLIIRGRAGPLSAELVSPPGATAVLALAHGAGAGYRHATMLAISEALAGARVATLRFNFPFMEAGRRRVDARPAAVAAVADAAQLAMERLPGLPLLVGGHSFGGRMASHALAEGAVLARGLICMSFPLHPANRPGLERAAHLGDVPVPMLFVSGTRDALARTDLLVDVVSQLGPRGTLHWLEDADHGYKVRKRERRDPRPVFDEMADAVTAFIDVVIAPER